MNMSNPYANQQRTALENASPQAAEGYALAELARRMDGASRIPDDFEAIRNIVRLNWRLWTIFQAELIDPDCPVPQQLRENLLSLSNFIDKRSAELIAKPEAAKLTVLININRQVGAGLLGNPSDDPQESDRLRREFAEQAPDPLQTSPLQTSPLQTSQPQTSPQETDFTEATLPQSGPVSTNPSAMDHET